MKFYLFNNDNFVGIITDCDDEIKDAVNRLMHGEYSELAYGDVHFNRALGVIEGGKS